MKKYFLSALALLSTLGVFAHEGHGHTHGYTIKHYFTEPQHALPLLAAVAAVVVLVNYFHKKAAKQ
ncbi:MAG: hypothetical protein U0V75_18345 [Ferruginibacter sp.]